MSSASRRSYSRLVSLHVGEAWVDASHESLGCRHAEEQLASVDRCPGSSPLISSASWSAETTIIRSSLAPQWREVQGVGLPVRRAHAALGPAARLQTIDERHEPARGEPGGKRQFALRSAYGLGVDPLDDPADAGGGARSAVAA